MKTSIRLIPFILAIFAVIPANSQDRIQISKSIFSVIIDDQPNSNIQVVSPLLFKVKESENPYNGDLISNKLLATAEIKLKRKFSSESDWMAWVSQYPRNKKSKKISISIKTNGDSENVIKTGNAHPLEYEISPDGYESITISILGLEI